MRANPLLERVKLFRYSDRNIDEFFMVRVAGLWQQIETRTPNQRRWPVATRTARNDPARDHRNYWRNLPAVARKN